MEGQHHDVPSKLVARRHNDADPLIEKPRDLDLYASPVYTFVNVAGWATTGPSIKFDPALFPGFFHVIIVYGASSSIYALAIRLRTSAGSVYQTKSASGIILPMFLPSSFLIVIGQ
jgi:hypothetical protein